MDCFEEIQQESATEFSASMFTAKLCPGDPIGDSIQQSVHGAGISVCP